MTERKAAYLAGPTPSDILADQLAMLGHGFTQEYQFHKPRRWRFDFALPVLKVALEINGGNWAGGRHVRPAALVNEYEKLNTAALDGWLVLLTTPEQVRSGEAVKLWESALVVRDEMEY